MTHPCIRRILIGMALALAPGPAAGQTVVYDPSNYAQNVLQAARALQDQQPDHQSSEPDPDAAQSGAEPDQPAVFGAAGDRPVDRAHPAVPQSGPAYLL